MDRREGRLAPPFSFLLNGLTVGLACELRPVNRLAVVRDEVEGRRIGDHSVAARTAVDEVGLVVALVDRVVARPGENRVLALRVDRVVAGAGPDEIRAPPGRDHVAAGAGRDAV